MSEAYPISAKNLGALALPDACLRCAWVKLHAPSGIPFQIFPGIFSSIDAYSKRVVHGWFDREGTAPPWLEDLGDVTGYVDPPHWSKFQWLEEQSRVVLRGSPDAIFTLSDGSYLIGDYKTAKFTGTQDRLRPMYEVQLNVYARIAEEQGLSPVSGLALIYTEPITGDDAAHAEPNQLDKGFAMGFGAHIETIELDPERIPRLTWQVRELVEMDEPPLSTTGCKDCDRMDGLLGLLGEIG